MIIDKKCNQNYNSPEAGSEVGIDGGKGLHLDLEGVQRLPRVHGGSGTEGASHEVDGHGPAAMVIPSVAAAVAAASVHPWLPSDQHWRHLKDKIRMELVCEAITLIGCLFILAFPAVTFRPHVSYAIGSNMLSVVSRTFVFACLCFRITCPPAFTSTFLLARVQC